MGTSSLLHSPLQCPFHKFSSHSSSLLISSPCFPSLHKCCKQPEVSCIPVNHWIASHIFASAAAMHHQHPVLEKKSEEELPSSAMAIAAAVAAFASLPEVKFTPRKADRHGLKGPFSGPSPELVALCQEQLSLCSLIFRHHFKMTIYARVTDSYGTADLELCRVTTFPGCLNEAHADASLLIGTFQAAAALRTIEAALAEQDVIELPEYEAVVLPMARDLFLVGFLVAEWMVQPVSRDTEHLMFRSLQPSWPQAKEHMDQQTLKDTLDPIRSRETGFLDDFSAESLDLQSRPCISLTTEQRMASRKVARSLAIACIMDQRTSLLQRSSWQRGVRIGNLVEQVRGSLVAIRTLGKMLRPQLKKGEISSDLVDDILVQGDRMKDVVQQLQEVLYLTMGRENQLNHNKFHQSIDKEPMNWDSSSSDSKSNTPEMLDLIINDDHIKQGYSESVVSTGNLSKMDIEVPMPPYALPPSLDMDYRPCDVLKLLSELVHAGVDLANQKGQTLELKKRPSGVPLFAAIDESALRRALCNLLDISLQDTFLDGSIKLEAMHAPGGGVLVVIDNNGPDLSLMAQSFVPSPLGTDMLVSAEKRNGRNILASVAAKFRVAQDILEQFGGILRITSPYLPDASFGTGGFRLEVWLPAPADKQT